MSEEIIQSDYEACDELLRVGGSRNTFIEANCERIGTWREFADLGEPRGQVLYGLCFFYGHGVDKDYAIAAQWFEKAAEQGDAQGEFSIGQSYLIEEDHEKAVEWITKSAEQGNAQGQFNVGYCYLNGQGVEENHEKAVKWLTKSAEQGNATAQCILGKCYLNGQGVEEDHEKAFEWFTMSAEQGNAHGQCIMGYRYLNGQGVEEDHQKAVEWYTKSAEQGNEDAKISIAVIRHPLPKVLTDAISDFEDSVDEVINILNCTHNENIGDTLSAATDQFNNVYRRFKRLPEEPQ